MFVCECLFPCFSFCLMSLALHVYLLAWFTMMYQCQHSKFVFPSLRSCRFVWLCVLKMFSFVSVCFYCPHFCSGFFCLHCFYLFVFLPTTVFSVDFIHRPVFFFVSALLACGSRSPSSSPWVENTTAHLATRSPARIEKYR